MGFLTRLLSPQRCGDADIAYHKAMGVSDDLLHCLRGRSDPNDAARSVISDVWSYHHNIPFLTSVYETVQEMKVGKANGGVPPPLPKK